MRWESLVSAQNLKLAWRRITTGRNTQYKRFFRDAYLVYESSLDENIRSLRASLRNSTWQASHATRVHLPKPSGLQRPLSLLELEDQIVLQAIANLVARQTRNQRRRVELDCVFSNILSSQADSIFFTERWQSTYQKFQETCEALFDAGYVWVADFDLASYYDTISHDLLFRIVSPTAINGRSAVNIMTWLGTWSAGGVATMTGHGIPQGPVASDFLAEAFFLPIDRDLQRQGYKYVRYVDDIRIFGGSENSVRKAVIELEQKARERGLIPQSTKFEIRRLRSSREAIGKLPSLTPSDPSTPTRRGLTDSQALTYLRNSIEGKPQKIVDKSRFRYTAFRAGPNAKVLQLMLRLLPRHPEHIDAFTAYFGNYSSSPRIARAALNYLSTGLPYSYVRGELWHLVARLGSKRECIDGLSDARSDARRRNECPVLSWGVMHFLIRCEREGIAKIGGRLRNEHPVSRSLLAPIIPDREFSHRGIARSMIRGSGLEQTSCSREMQKRSVSLSSIGLRQRNIPVVAANSLKSLGVIKRRTNKPQDWINSIFVDVYRCTSASVWRGLLGTEYEHALQIAIEMKARAPGVYSDWLSLQDSINDVLTRKLVSLLQTNGKISRQKLIDKNGKLVKYGSLLDPKSPFASSYPAIADRFRDVHKRRNQLPGSHPYDERGGTRNRWLTKREQRGLIAKQRVALNDIVSTVAPII